MSSSSSASIATSSSASPSLPCGKARRLGVFIGRVDDSYQRDIWRSIVLRASEKGATVVGFFGFGLGSPLPSTMAMNVVYSMAGPGNLDGLIVLSNTIGNFETPENVARLVAESSLPAVSVQVPLAGLPCVSAANEPALSLGGSSAILFTGDPAAAFPSCPCAAARRSLSRPSTLRTAGDSVSCDLGPKRAISAASSRVLTRSSPSRRTIPGQSRPGVASSIRRAGPFPRTRALAGTESRPSPGPTRHWNASDGSSCAERFPVSSSSPIVTPRFGA